jgi:glycosyltransferase involved in cell wall biosynthesis
MSLRQPIGFAAGRSARMRLGRWLRALPAIRAGRATRSSSGLPRVRFVYRELGASTQYRVRNQIEQAELAGLPAQALSIDEIDQVADLRSCDLLYLHRLTLWPSTGLLCLAARRRRIPIIFDSDDLVWDPRDRYYSFYDRHYSAYRVARTLLWIYRIRMLMRWANAFVFSTPYLAYLAAQTFSQPGYVNHNALSRAMLADAEAAYAQRRQRPAGRTVVIGYFCGTPHAHDEDIGSVGPALAAVLDRHPDVRLRIYGELRLADGLDRPAYAARIERHPVVPWRMLPHHIAQVDINIAPIMNNPQRRAKSAVKYLEAAAVGVPTVASRLETYQHAMADGATGLLAMTTEEWVDSLARLIQSPELRQQLGDAAREQVLAHHTTAARAANFADIIAKVAG